MNEIIKKIPVWVLIIISIVLTLVVSFIVVYTIVTRICTIELGALKVTPIETMQSKTLPSESFRYNNLPKLGSRWKVIYPEKEYKNEIVSIYQNGSEFTGELLESDASAYAISGNIIYRNLAYTVKPNNSKDSYYGVGLLKLSQDAKSADGYVVHLDEVSETPKVTRVRIIEVAP